MNTGVLEKNIISINFDITSFNSYMLLSKLATYLCQHYHRDIFYMVFLNYLHLLLNI